jgi:RNA recognition motif-containing protein
VESDSEEEEKPAPKKAVAAKPVKAQKKPEPIEEEKPAEDDEEGVFEVCARGLSFQAYDSDIRTLFETCGEVLEVKLLTRDDGKSKGTAFIKFSKKSAFNSALELNGSEHLGRNITVEESQGKKPFNNNGASFGGQQRGGFNQRGGQQGGSYPAPGNANIETPTLFIGGLSYNSTADSIRDFFSSVGEVSSARVVTDKETGKVHLSPLSPAASVTSSSTIWTLPRRPTRN